MSFFFRAMQEPATEYGYISRDLEFANEKTNFKGHLFLDSKRGSLFVGKFNGDNLAVMKGAPLFEYLKRKVRMERLYREYSVLTSLSRTRPQEIRFPQVRGWVHSSYCGMIITPLGTPFLDISQSYGMEKILKSVVFFIFFPLHFPSSVLISLSFFIFSFFDSTFGKELNSALIFLHTQRRTFDKKKKVLPKKKGRKNSRKKGELFFCCVLFFSFFNQFLYWFHRPSLRILLPNQLLSSSKM